MSVAKLKLAPAAEIDVRTEARVHLRALLNDGLAALTAIDAGDYSGADASLRHSMLAAHDCRAVLQAALTPPAPEPKAQVDAALKDWFA